MADYYLYDKLEQYLIRRDTVDKQIPMIQVTYQFGTDMGNTHIDFSNAYKTDLDTTQTELFNAFNSIAQVLYQSVFCCKLVEIKDMNTKRSLRSNIEPLKSYLAGIFKIVDKRKSNILPKYRFVYFDGREKPPDWVYKSKSPIEKALDNTAYIFKKSSILPSRDSKAGLFENANSFFIKPLTVDALKEEIKKKTHGLQKQIIIVENFDETSIDIPINIETVIISIDRVPGPGTAPGTGTALGPGPGTGPAPGTGKPNIKYIKNSNKEKNEKFINLLYNGCLLKKYNCIQDGDDITDYTYDNETTLEHREETIEYVVLSEVNVIINAINDVTTATEEADFTVSMPSLGSAMPSLGSAMPSLGSAMPSLGSAMPSLGSAMPSLGSAPPSLGSAPPSLGSAPPGTTCLVAYHPIAVTSSKGHIDGIYDPMPDMYNNATVYKSRNSNSTYRIYFEITFWKIVNDTNKNIIISRCPNSGNPILPNLLTGWTENVNVLDLKSYFEKINDVTQIIYGLSKMTTVIRINNIFNPSTAKKTYQCEKEGDYINIPKYDELVPYGLVKIKRSVVDPFVYIGALIYNSETKETWGKGTCTYENGDKYKGEVTYTDTDKILQNGTGILKQVNGDVFSGTWNESNLVSGTFTSNGKTQTI
jgi:hypothetical protein